MTNLVPAIGYVRVSRRVDVFEQWSARIEAAGGRVERTESVEGKA